jgi:hypothetical protein
MERTFQTTFLEKLIHPRGEDQPMGCDFGDPQFGYYIVFKRLVWAVFATIQHLLEEAPSLELGALERALYRLVDFDEFFVLMCIK